MHINPPPHWAKQHAKAPINPQLCPYFPGVGGWGFTLTGALLKRIQTNPCEKLHQRFWSIPQNLHRGNSVLSLAAFFFSFFVIFFSIFLYSFSFFLFNFLLITLYLSPPSSGPVAPTGTWNRRQETQSPPDSHPSGERPSQTPNFLLGQCTGQTHGRLGVTSRSAVYVASKVWRQDRFSRHAPGEQTCSAKVRWVLTT